ncbi:MAG: alpha/beta hydrolase [Jaaginema sp. PMC 1079.18]|nr:alpha/beta hydrolase [Jaaginema sp. PMC 1080.18]MEC4852785.1 alpha/beta hydrolase [Jaaginema sp. PMC 1079.18]MEC4864910.1 alpha/beta hydrolase [Jaaginema sp. PMC 1078.18]
MRFPLTITQPQIQPQDLAAVKAYKQSLSKAIQNAAPLPQETLARAIALRHNLSKAPFISPPLPEAQNRLISSQAGQINLHIIIPETVKGIYLDIHGGGWVVGNATISDRLKLEMAQTAQVAVVSIEYRLAPEYPYPTPIDDCEAAALWLLDNALTEFGTEKIIIGGESAGAHLAVMTLLRLRDRHFALEQILGANLFYGVYDLSGSPSWRQGNEEDNFDLTPTQMEWYVSTFLAGIPPEKRRKPTYSPLYADLQQMPPALFSVSNTDILRDDSLFLATRWAAAGSQAELVMYPELPHGFTLLPLAIAHQANQRSREFVRCLVAKP